MDLTHELMWISATFFYIEQIKKKKCDLKFNQRAFFVNLNDTYNVAEYVIKVT